ncbi:hypothetical protein Taro_024887, partial [Colocasia esculenta]|nr:hypothetical protein [Colocasia esculenta]
SQGSSGLLRCSSLLWCGEPSSSASLGVLCCCSRSRTHSPPPASSVAAPRAELVRLPCSRSRARPPPPASSAAAPGAKLVHLHRRPPLLLPEPSSSASPGVLRCSSLDRESSFSASSLLRCSKSSQSKAHPKASAFRVNGFRWEEEGKALFEGVLATGSIGWGPASRCAKPISSSSTTHEVEDEHVDHEESSSMGTMGTSNDANPVEAEFMSVEPSKKKKKQVHDIDIKFEKLIDIFMHDVENVTQGGPSVICAPSLIDCCKKLDEMALSRTDVLYAQAVVLFSDEKMREQWMQCETYRYYDLPFCTPDHVTEKKEALGEVLNGRDESYATSRFFAARAAGHAWLGLSTAWPLRALCDGCGGDLCTSRQQVQRRQRVLLGSSGTSLVERCRQHCLHPAREPQWTTAACGMAAPTLTKRPPRKEVLQTHLGSISGYH